MAYSHNVLLAIILPPLGVFLERGCTCDLAINIALTCLGFIPGISKFLCAVYEMDKEGKN